MGAPPIPLAARADHNVPDPHRKGFSRQRRPPRLRFRLRRGWRAMFRPAPG